MKILKYLLYALIFGDAFNREQFTVLKDIYNTYIFGRPLRTMIKKGDNVLELGCGKDSLIMRSGLIKIVNVTGVDIFKPYVDMHKARGLYRNCIHADIIKVEFNIKQYDVVVCMDVLEHLSKEDGRKLLINMQKWAKKVIITTPNGYVNGIPSDGNDYQNHKSGWTKEELGSYGYKVRGASGWKPLRKPDSQLRYIHPLIFWAGLSLISSLAVYWMPDKAFHLQATYE